MYGKFIKLIALLLFVPSLQAAVLPWEATTPWESWDDLSDFGTWTLPAAALGIAAYKGDYEGMAQLGVGWAVTQLGTEGVKTAFPKQRPNGSAGTRSAASGHTSSAFSAAAFLHHRYGWEYGVPAYAYAGLTGLARVKAKKHYPEDVLVGALLGIGVSYMFTPKFEDEPFSVSATTSKDGGFGLGFAWVF